MTPVARSDPEFVTVNVKLMLLPTCGVLLLTVLLNERSAEGMGVFVGVLVGALVGVCVAVGILVGVSVGD